MGGRLPAPFVAKPEGLALELHKGLRLSSPAFGDAIGPTAIIRRLDTLGPPVLYNGQ